MQRPLPSHEASGGFRHQSQDQRSVLYLRDMPCLSTPQPRIGKLGLDWDGLTWKVAAYTNHPVYPYTLRRYYHGRMIAEWLADEVTVKILLERARKEPQRVHPQDE